MARRGQRGVRRSTFRLVGLKRWPFRDTFTDGFDGSRWTLPAEILPLEEPVPVVSTETIVVAGAVTLVSERLHPAYLAAMARRNQVPLAEPAAEPFPDALFKSAPVWRRDRYARQPYIRPAAYPIETPVVDEFLFRAPGQVWRRDIQVRRAQPSRLSPDVSGALDPELFHTPPQAWRRDRGAPRPLPTQLRPDVSGALDAELFHAPPQAWRRDAIVRRFTLTAYPLETPAEELPPELFHAPTQAWRRDRYARQPYTRPAAYPIDTPIVEEFMFRAPGQVWRRDQRTTRPLSVQLSPDVSGALNPELFHHPLQTWRRDAIARRVTLAAYPLETPAEELPPELFHAPPQTWRRDQRAIRPIPTQLSPEVSGALDAELFHAPTRPRCDRPRTRPTFPPALSPDVLGALDAQLFHTPPSTQRRTRPWVPQNYQRRHWHPIEDVAVDEFPYPGQARPWRRDTRTTRITPARLGPDVLDVPVGVVSTGITTTWVEAIHTATWAEHTHTGTGRDRQHTGALIEEGHTTMMVESGHTVTRRESP